MIKYNPPCPFRLAKGKCEESYSGKCCCECDKYESCEEACKNTPQAEPKGCGRIERWNK